MPVAGPELGDAVSGLLAEKGIRFYPLHKLAAVDKDRRELRFEQAIPFRQDLLTTPFRYDLLLSIPPHRAPKAVVESGLTNQTGWVPVDRQTLRTSRDGVYAIGDVTAIQIPGRWKPEVPLMLPKAGVFAHAQAEVVAARISAEIDGRKADSTFCGDGYCMLEAGEDLAGFAYGNFFAEPSPQVNLRQIGKAWHVGKVMFERWWLASPGRRRDAYGALLKIGGRLYGIPIAI
jgi:sulfide:quinone oxidoreductase